MATPLTSGRIATLMVLSAIVGAAASLVAAPWLSASDTVRFDPVQSTLLGYFLLALATLWFLHSESDKRRTFATRQLYFAAVVLTALGLIFVLSMVMYVADPAETSAGGEIFDASVKTIPPIVTLVLGYYFGRRSEEDEEDKEDNEGDPNRAEQQLTSS